MSATSLLLGDSLSSTEATGSDPSRGRSVRTLSRTPTPLKRYPAGFLALPELVQDVTYWVHDPGGLGIPGRGVPIGTVLQNGRVFSGRLINPEIMKRDRYGADVRVRIPNKSHIPTTQSFAPTQKIETPTGLRVSGDVQEIVYMTTQGLGAWANQYRRAILNRGLASWIVEERAFWGEPLEQCDELPCAAKPGSRGYLVAEGFTGEGRLIVGLVVRSTAGESKIHATVTGGKGITVTPTEIPALGKLSQRIAPDSGAFNGPVRLWVPQGGGAYEELEIGHGYVADHNAARSWVDEVVKRKDRLSLDQRLVSARRKAGRLYQTARVARGLEALVGNMGLEDTEPLVAPRAAVSDHLEFRQSPLFLRIGHSSLTPQQGRGDGVSLLN